SVLAVGLLMFGSAVPLHVAQVQTTAVELWKVIQASASARGAWIGAGPLGLIAVIASVLIVRRLDAAVRVQQQEESEDLIVGRTPGRGAWGAFGLVWAMSVPIPGLIFFLSLRQWRSIVDFWRVNDQAVLESLQTGLAVGLAAVLLAVAFG